MVRVGDLVEPGPEEVGLTCLPPLVGSHESPRRDPDGSMESRLPGRSNCQKSPPSRPETGKHEYVPRPKAHARSDIWQFFTDDYTRSARSWNAEGRLRRSLAVRASRASRASRLSSASRARS